MTHLRASLLACLLIVAGASNLAAQVARGQLTGIVRDPNGALVPGATVTVTAVNTNLQHTVTTSGGVYAVPGLVPGLYTLGVELSGFRPFLQDGIRVTTGETVRLDVDLLVGDVSESITVTADAPLLRTETGSLGQVIGEEKIVGLPLNGRLFITLAALVPGVALPPGSLLPRINGGRPRTNEYLVRRHFGAAARARTGRVLPGDRRYPGIQDRNQQSARPSSGASTAASSICRRSRERTASGARRSSSSATRD